MLVVALGAHLLLGLPWQLAVLLGAATSATDAAAVFSVLRVVPLPKRLVGALEAESGLNDAPTVVLVTLVATGAAQEHGIPLMLAEIVFELAVGSLVGLAVGVGGAWVMRRAALPASGLYPIAVVCLTLLGYGAAAALHASGFAAVYLAALVLGNTELPHRPPRGRSPRVSPGSRRSGCSSCSGCCSRRGGSPSARSRRGSGSAWC